MKKQKIAITREESDRVEQLFTKHTSYLSMLEYFAAQGLDNSTIYEKKWNEAAELWIQLDKAKRDVEKKYKPDGDWDRYEFDFENHQVVFVKE